MSSQSVGPVATESGELDPQDAKADGSVAAEAPQEGRQDGLEESAATGVSWRRLLELARPYVGRLAVVTLLMLAGASTGLFIPMLAGGVVDAAIGSGETVADLGLGTLVLSLIGVFALLGLVGFVESYLLLATGARLLNDLRNRLFGHLVELALPFWDARRVGELVSRVGADLALVQASLTQQIPSGLQATLRFCGTLVILLWLQPRLTLVALGVVPPVVLLAIWFGRRLEKLSKRSRDAAADATSWLEESLSGIRTILAGAVQQRATVRYRDLLDQLLAIQLRNAWFHAGFSGLLVFAGFSSFALVLGYGGRLMTQGVLSAGELTSFLLYTFSIAVSVGQLGSLYAGYRQLRGASTRVFELLDEQTAVEDHGTEDRPISEGRVVFRGVHFAYEEARPVLRGLSLRAEAGETVALVGPSGSGKSTVLALLLRLYERSAGEIEIDGRSIESLPLARLRSTMALVPQEIFLFSGTVRENLELLSPGATEQELRLAIEAAGADEFIDRLPEGWHTTIGERGIRLSAGQRQRLAIARAFARDPRILLLDEATSSLDAASEARVRQALEGLLEGRTTFVIAHRLATAKRADRIYVVEEGQISATGRHDELYESNDLYREYWKLQSLTDSAEADTVAEVDELR